MNPRKIALLAVLLSTFAVTGCASHMTNEEIAAYGTARAHARQLAYVGA